MFKFAANKLTGHHSSSSGGTGASSSQNNPQNPNSLLRNINNTNNISSMDSTTTTTAQSNTAARRRYEIQKDLFAFAFNKIADKGFPSKPSAMDYDRKLKLLAIGTKNGDIRIYGEPNTLHQQLSCYQDMNPFPVMRLLFVQGQHQLITLSERVSRNEMTSKNESHLFLVLWQIPNLAQLEHANNKPGSNLVEKIKEYQLEPKIVNNTRLSAITLLNDNSHLFIGFETGDVYVFNVGTFQMVPGVINKDYILKNLPAPTSPDLKKLTSLGAVESICHHPRQLTKLLIAYQKGLWLLFDFIKNQIEQVNQTQQQLESAVFYQNGECVASAHSDGSFILWDLSSATPIQAVSTTGTSTPDQPSTSTTVSPTIPTTCSSSSAPNIVYGPYPCKAVNKCLVKTCRADQPYVIFSGGCPRVNYSDKITITVIQGEQAHVCFDFTSKIIEFFTVDKPSTEKMGNNNNNNNNNNASGSSSTIVYDNPQALFVLLEEEFVAIDLVSDQWPQYKLPYLCSVHSSAIICTHYANGVSRSFYDKLVKYGTASVALEPGELYSDRDWPIGSSSSSSNNAIVAGSDQEKRDLLLTGHEDGSVRFWDVTNMSMTLLYRLRTSDYFQTDSTPMGNLDAEPNSDVDNWPPFRKVGTFDPYSDDPKLGIQKIHLCPKRELIAVAGTAGQVLLMTLCDQARELAFANIEAHKLNIIESAADVASHYQWKGHDGLLLRGRLEKEQPQEKVEGSMKLAPGYQLHTMIQLYPPATVSALALNTEWQLLAMGTSHGFALFDYNHGKDLLTRCTLDPAMLLASNESGTSATISRRKSLKKSLRESFRKLRRGRSQKPGYKKPTVGEAQSVQHMKSLQEDEMNEAASHRPVERQVESREFKPVDDIPPSVIRYMYFVRTHITSSQQQTNSLWVGTNTGIIYIYALQFMLNASNVSAPKPALIGQTLNQTKTSMPSSTAANSGTLRTNQSINCLLAKEMRLKHRAPVVHIQVIDQNMQPLPLDSTDSSLSIETSQQSTAISSQTSNNNNHKVIICSEEQFKVFQLPSLKPVCKFKLTAVEGARVRRIGYSSYASRQDPRHQEYCLSCLSNLGEISIYSLPALKRLLQKTCMKQQDINAITSFVFSKQGQAFYLQSPSEFVHISMSSQDSPLQMVNQLKQQQQQLKLHQSPQKEVRPVPKKQPSQEKTTKTEALTPTPTPSATTSTSTPAPVNTEAQLLSSPKSPPPPVPAPRTTVPTNTSTNNTNNLTSLTTKEETSRTLNDSTPIKTLTTTTPPPQTATSDSTVKETEPDVDINKEKRLNGNISDSMDTSNKKLNFNDECETVEKGEKSSALLPPLSSPIKSMPPKPIPANRSADEANSLANTSIITNSGLTSTSTLAALNQSIVNANNVTHLTMNGAGNCSISTGQSDSLNASSSGYNGSSSYNTFNLSMDSVIDKFSDEFSQLLSKKIPSSIDEDSSVKANDSLLNESQLSNHPVVTRSSMSHTNGHSKLANGHEFSNGVHKEKRQSDTNGVENGHCSTNGQNGHHNNINNNTSNNNEQNHALELGPQKASSPLIKMNIGQHGHNGHNGHSLNIEQVTKRIENGNKLEYRETAID